jgi:hypothetical protein
MTLEPMSPRGSAQRLEARGASQSAAPCSVAADAGSAARRASAISSSGRKCAAIWADALDALSPGAARVPGTIVALRCSARRLRVSTTAVKAGGASQLSPARLASPGRTIGGHNMSLEPNRDRVLDEQRRDRVIIAAAVAALLGRPAVIRKIRPAPAHGAGAWSREGRLAVQRSHAMPAPLIGQGRARGEGRA